MEIDALTVNLHCGSRRDVVDKQIQDLKPLEDMGYKIHWNLRIENYPHAFPSYSQLMNFAIATSKYEWMIFVNDRTTADINLALKMIQHIKDGFACSMMYNVGYMMFSKELIRNIGFFDESYKLGGYEDRDFVYRICKQDLALYESQEATYDYNWKSLLQEIGHNCRLSQPYWDSKWENKYTDAIIQMLPDPVYEHWNLFLGESRRGIKNSWKKWEDSVLNIGFDKPNSGPSSSSMIKSRKIVNYEDVKHLIK